MNGRINDSQVWNESKFKEEISDPKNPLNLPREHLFVADDAYPLSEHLLKPYTGDRLDFKCSIFNYRLSRSRRIIENVFGIMAMMFRVLLVTINISPERACDVVLAVCVLHNFLIAHKSAAPAYLYQNVDTNDEDNGAWRKKVDLTLVTAAGKSVNNGTKKGTQTRDALCDHFMTEGAVDFQWKMVGKVLHSKRR